MGVGSCCYAISAIFVIVISIIIFLIGLALTGIGGILLWGNSIFNSYISPMLKTLLDGVAIEGFTIDSNNLIQSVLEFLKPLAVALFIVGIFLVIMGFSGMFGSCCKNKCLLYTFGILASAILIAELVMVIYVGTSTDKFINMISDYLKNQISTSYIGIKGSNLISLLVNVMNAMLGCCGASGGEDFQNASKWENTYSYTKSGYSFNGTLQYPITCCKMKNFKPITINCTWDPTPGNSNYKIGCISNKSAIFNEYLNYVVGGIGGLLGLQVFLVTFGILMLCHIIGGEKSKIHAKY